MGRHEDGLPAASRGAQHDNNNRATITLDFAPLTFASLRCVLLGIYTAKPLAAACKCADKRADGQTDRSQAQAPDRANCCKFAQGGRNKLTLLGLFSIKFPYLVWHHSSGSSHSHGLNGLIGRLSGHLLIRILIAIV